MKVLLRTGFLVAVVGVGLSGCYSSTETKKGTPPAAGKTEKSAAVSNLSAGQYVASVEGMA